LAARPSHIDAAGEHDHDDFTSFSVELGEVASPEGLVDRLLPLVDRFGILRIKGFAAVAGRDMRLVTQGVGRRLQCYYDRGWREGEVRRTSLVVIGERGLDEAGIRGALAG
jgi:cobalamin biosynthesis protein CobW